MSPEVATTDTAHAVAVSGAIPRAGGHWLLGNAREMSGRAHRFPAEAGWRQGGLAPLRVLHKRFLAVTHPDYARQILVTRHDRYQRSSHNRNLGLLLGDGLLSTDGDLWLKRRRQILPAFRIDTLRRALGPVLAATNDLLARWETETRNGRDILLTADMQRLTLAVIGRALLSTDVNGNDALRFGQAVRDGQVLIRRRNTSAWNAPMWIPTRGNRRLREARAALDTYLDPYLQSRRTDVDSEKPITDMLDALLQARDPDTGEALPHDALRDETKTLFLAGFETTATALIWALYMLARHSEAADRLYDELDQVLGGNPPAYEDLERLTWTQQIVQETLRLYPPVYNLGRQCVTEDELGDHTVRPGTVLLISIFGIHRAAAWWPQPELFDPDRFAPGRDWPRNAYLPFAVGKHVCIGASFAINEMVAVLALIGQRFRFSLTDDRPVGEIPRITLAPEREIPLRLTPR